MRIPAFRACAILVVLLLAPFWSGAKAPAEEVLSAYRDRIEKELQGNILPFWIRHTVDRERGGFFGEISNDLVVKKDAVRGALLTSRILWTYSAAYRRYGDAAYREMADWAYQDLSTRFWDPEFGGVYWTAAADGKPVQTRKQIYGQVFAIYALSEYHRATKHPEALQRATFIFQRIEAHARDNQHGGYWEVCSRDWKRESDPRQSSLEGYGAKSQNTHLHVMEAYTNLLRVWPDEELKRAQTALVSIMLERILDSKTFHLALFLTDDWKPTTEEISFGHDIEAAWLLTEAAEVLSDPALLRRTKEVALQIARVTQEQGIDPEGALYYEAKNGRVTKSDREWWPQAEGVVGFLNAYQLNGDPVFLQTALRLWDFIDGKLVDKQHGEWYRSVTREGRIPPHPKVSLWKCSYHNGRACLEAIARLEALTQRRAP